MNSTICTTKSGLNKKRLLTNHGPNRIVKQVNDVIFIVKKSLKSRQEIVHIDQLS